jgi:hypothetical protein
MRTVSRFLQGSLFGIVALALGATWVLAPSGQAASTGNPEAELKTAQTHAGFAATYDSLQEVTLHLHHVLNCVAGPQDIRFDASAGNPCQGQGDGALPDLKAKAGEDGQYYFARWIARIADEGIASKNLGEAKAAARVITLALQGAMQGK